MAIFSIHVTQGPTTPTGAILASPGGGHWFGTDEAGRDVLSRTLAGARTVLIIAPLATVLCLLVGGGVGLLAGSTSGPHRRGHHAARRRGAGAAGDRRGDRRGRRAGPVVAILILVIGVLFTPVVSRTIRAAA